VEISGYPTEVVESVRFIYASQAWQDFFEPRLKDIRQTMLELLADPSKTRKDGKSDDYVRGCIATIQHFLDLPQGLIADADAQIAAREADQDRAHRADLGTP
jgi:hypothetical protein